MIFMEYLTLAKENAPYFFKVPPESQKTWRKIPSLEELTKKYGVSVKSFTEFYDDLAQLNPNKIYVLNGENSDSHLKVRSAFLDFPEKYKYLNERVDSDPLIYEMLADSRSRKSPKEQELMAYINKVTIEAHINCWKLIKPKMLERDIENNFLGFLYEKYYTRTFAYPAICGCGEDSATLHYVKNDKVLEDGQLVLMDCGIMLGGYSSDVTSTVPINGKFTKKQKDIYDLVLKANRSVMSYLKPGIWWADMQLAAENVILTGLQQLGLINSGFEVSELIDNRIAYYFMPHGLGHFLGIDVHDVGGYLSFTPPRVDKLGLKRLRTARYLEDGNIITVEPGIYFIPFLLERAFNDDGIKKKNTLTQN